MNKFLVVLCFGISFISLHVKAQINRDSIKFRQMNEITVVGNLSGSFSMPMSVVNKRVLETGTFNTPADALRRETGISLSRDGIWGTSVNVRGLSEQRLLFLIDGDRIHTSSDIAAALSTVDMASLEKIEVIKGASSVLYGSGAMGGIVNFVSARPLYTQTYKTTGKVSTGFNSVNSLWENNANLNFSTKQWYIALNGSLRTANNTKNPIDITNPTGLIQNSQFHDASWALKAGIKYAYNEELLVNYQHVGAWDVGIPGVNSLSYLSTARYKKVDRNQLSGEYLITDITDNLTRLSLKVYTQNVARDVEIIANPAAISFPKQYLFPRSNNTTSGAKIVSDWLFTPNHSLVAGVEGWQRKSETTRTRVVVASDTAYTVFGEQPVANARQLDLGAFAYYSLKIIPSKLTLNAGIRLDYIRTENDSAFSPVFKYSVSKGIRTDVTNLSRTLLFKAGIAPEIAYAAHLDLLYNIAYRQSVSLSVANSYRAASIDERFKYIDLGALTKVGNPDLKPERGTFANLNYTFSGTSLLVKMNVFANYLFDLITEKSGTYIGRSALINTNVSKALFVGAELEANCKISKQFSVMANASYTRARDVDAGTALPQIPPMSGFAALNYSSGKLLDASLSTEWAATQNEFATGENPTAGHVIFNMDVHSRPIHLNNTALQFFAGSNNLLNTAYYNHLTSVRNGGTLYYEPGRNIYLKAKLNF